MAVAAIAALAMAGSALASAPAQIQLPAYVHPWFEIGGYHNSRDDDATGSFGTSRGETTIFAPISGGQRTLLFGQVTAKFFSDSATEGNVALGYRRMMPSGVNFGAWLGTDIRRTEMDNSFLQLSGGFEALSKNIDARVNWYGPITKPRSAVAGFAQVHLQGNQIFMTGGDEVGLMGVDGEIGFRLPTEYAGLDPKIFELRAYAGGYFFDHSDALEDITGVKGRLELRVNDVIAALPGSRLTAEYEVSHDDVRDTRHEVGMRVRIPFGTNRPIKPLASLTGQQRRMLDGIERDTDIVTVRSKAEAVEDGLTGTAFDRVAYASATSDVTTTSTAAGANSLIILNGTVVGAQTLQANQTLQSGGATITVRGKNSKTAVAFIAPGATGRLTTPGAVNDSLTLGGSNTHVAGITIVGHGAGGAGDGVSVGDNRSNVFLTNLNISNAGDDSVDIEDNNQVTVINLTSTNPVEDGIDISDDNNVTIIGGSISNSGEEGIEISDDNVVSITGITITNNNAEDGISMFSGNNVTIRNVSITGPGNDGIQANFGNTLNISGLTVTNMDYAISLFGSPPGNGNSATITNSTFSNINTDVFYVEPNNSLSVTNSVINGAGNDVFFLTLNVSLFVSGNTFNGTVADDLFDFDGPINTVVTGSTGNVNNATVNDLVCEANGFGSFSGTVSFVNGTVLTDNVAPCN
ncbi:MAG: right-handed parallel beta-helix repeat-containing protein [Pseudomonadota bacterium]